LLLSADRLATLSRALSPRLPTEHVDAGSLHNTPCALERPARLPLIEAAAAIHFLATPYAVC
jgi:hypothetical protein